MTHAFTLDNAHAIVLAHPHATEATGQLSELVISETTISFTWKEMFLIYIHYQLDPTTGIITESVDGEVYGDHENFSDLIEALNELFADAA